MSGAVITELAAAVDPDNREECLASLPAARHRATNAPAVMQTLEFLRRRFQSAGWAVVDQPCLDPTFGPGVNLVATLPGRRTDALVVVGAHHDTVRNTLGADDNASGLAGLLELANLLHRASWEATIQLVAFDFEETGDDTTEAPFAGSRRYVGALEREITVRGAFVFEMIGYASHKPNSQRGPEGLDRIFPEQAQRLAGEGWRGDFIAGLGNDRRLTNAFLEAATSTAPGLNVVAFDVPPTVSFRHLFRSDHVAFWEAGLPALMLTDTAEFRNPNYHRPTDTAETLVSEFWRDVVAATLSSVATLAHPL